MPQISEFATWINPLLRTLKDLGGSARPREAVDHVARMRAVPDQVLDQTIQNGASRFANQVHWARFYLAEDGYIDRSRRGVWRLTEKGHAAPDLSNHEIRSLIERVQASSGRSTGSRSNERGDQVQVSRQAVSPPLENVEVAPEEEHANHRTALLSVLRSLPSAGFERLCQRLLREAGFEEVVVTGRSGDGGIDGHGVLVLNAFVSFRVLFQCKRYEGSVGPAQVRDFRGAMQGRADKGIILTTGAFTVEARREATRDGVPPIELVDSEKLISLFEQLQLGLEPRTAYEVDDAFFTEYRT